jgi:hypothetical protein
MNDLTVTEYRNIRVLTTQQIAEAYETDARVISNNFNRNKERYIEGKHFICLEGEDKRGFVDRHQFDDASKKATKLYLWTEKGAFLHAKSLNTDKAWEVYDHLVDTYFNRKEDLLNGISPELKAVLVVDRRVTTVEKKIDNLENTMNIDYTQQKKLRDFVNEVVKNVLGGKDSKAYRYKDEENGKLSARVFSRIWHDFYDYFNINAYANLPRVKFKEAIEYINRWQPSTNMQLEIGRINRME